MQGEARPSSRRGRALPDPGARARVLTCGDIAAEQWSAVVADALPAAMVRAVGPRPGRAEVDPLLDGAGLVVVAGDDADLAAVLVRLLRRERLDVPVAFLPAAGSTAAGVWGAPTRPGDVAAALGAGTPRPRPLIRDDRGGVVAARHAVEAFRGVVYCDEHLLASGDSAGLVVAPWVQEATGGGGVEAVVTGPPRWGGLRPARTSAARGRAVQIGCRPALLRRGRGRRRPHHGAPQLVPPRRRLAPARPLTPRVAAHGAAARGATCSVRT